MADLKKFTITIDGIEKIVANLKTLQEALNETASSSSITDLKQNLEALGEAYDSSADKAVQASKTMQALQQDNESYQSSLQTATSALREQNQEVEKTSTLHEAQQGSIEQLKLSIKELTEKYEGLSEAEREISGSDLLFHIQMLQEELTTLETMSNSHLGTFGTLGEVLNTVSEGFNNTNSVINSFSGILSSGSDVLRLFGVESQTLTDAIENLSAITQTLNTLQALHSQLVAKDSIVMKAAAVAKKLYTAATQGSSLALNGFKAAMISTGIGAFVVLIGYLIANFDEVKQQIGGATGGMDRFDGIMKKVEPVIAGVGNVIVQFLVHPIKQFVNMVEGLINVIDIFGEKGLKGFGDAIDEVGNTVKRGAKIQMDTLNVAKNYQEGVNKSNIAAAKKAAKERLQVEVNSKNDYIKTMEAKHGADWKYTAEGVKAYEEYFDKCLALYEKDSEEYKNIQRQKLALPREVEERKNKPTFGGSSKKSSSPEPDNYLEDLKEVRDKGKAIQREIEEKQVEHYRKLAAQSNPKEAIGYMQEAIKTEKALQKDKHQQEIDEQTEHQQKLQKQYAGNTKRLAELNESFGLTMKALGEKQAKERMELSEKLAGDLRVIAEKEKADAIKIEIEKNEKLIAEQNGFIEAKKAKSEEANKDMVVRNWLGLIDVKATKEKYAKAIDADTKYLTQLNVSHLRKKELLEKDQKQFEKGSQEWKNIQDKISAEDKKFADDKDAINARIGSNMTKSMSAQQEFLKDLQVKMKETWGQISEGMTTVCGAANAIIQQQLTEAKAKLEDVTKQYGAIVEKRKEGQDKIKSLEEEAASASGGRAIAIEEQIARQMEANAELAMQEKDLAKEKEKLEKDIARKEKQAKKIELGQKLVQSVADVAFAVTKAMTAGPFAGQILAALTAAAGAVQVGIISRQISKLEDGGLIRGKSHAQGGMRIEGTNIEVEGNEFVVNKISTRKNLGLIDYINKQRRELSSNDLSAYFNRTGGKNSPQEHTFKRMYEQGGQLTNLDVVNSATAPDSNRVLEAISKINFQPVVSVVDIADAQNNIAQVKDIAGVRI